MLHENIQYNAIKSIKNKLIQDPYPEVIEIHPTDICNQRCDYCFHGGIGYDSTRAKEVLSLEEYHLLFKEMRENKIKNLSISGGGEPFLDKRLKNILAKAIEEDLNIRIVSNGNFLENSIFKILSQIKELRISIDASTANTYALIRKVKPEIFDKTISNISSFKKISTELESNVSIGVSFLMNNHNYKEVVSFCELMLSINIDSIVIKHDIYSKYFIGSEMEEHLDKIQEMKTDKIEIRAELKGEISGTKCFVPYFKVAFNPYGELYSCCLGSQPNEKNGYLFGTIKNTTFADLWKDSSNIRKSLQQNGVSCVNCNHTDIQINNQFKY